MSTSALSVALGEAKLHHFDKLEQSDGDEYDTC